MKASDNPYPSAMFDEQASPPAAPAAGQHRLFIDDAGVWKSIDSGSVVSPLDTSGAALTVEEDDASPSISDVDTLQFEADDFVVTNPSAGIAHVALANPPSGSAATVVRKTADESVTSSTTLQDDDHLLFAVGANEIWSVTAYLRVDGATAGDFKAAFSAPAAAAGWQAVIGPGTGATTFEDAATNNQAATLGTAPSAGMLGAGNFVLVQVIGLIVNGANAGNVVLQWAQRASSATATRIMTNSFLVAHQIA